MVMFFCKNKLTVVILTEEFIKVIIRLMNMDIINPLLIGKKIFNFFFTKKKEGSNCLMFKLGSINKINMDIMRHQVTVNILLKIS